MNHSIYMFNKTCRVAHNSKYNAPHHTIYCVSYACAGAVSFFSLQNCRGHTHPCKTQQPPQEEWGDQGVQGDGWLPVPLLSAWTDGHTQFHHSALHQMYQV